MARRVMGHLVRVGIGWSVAILVGARCWNNKRVTYDREEQSGATLMIKLDQFLKLMGAVQTGGEAKFRIQEGHVKVNGEQELRRGRKLVLGDSVDLEGQIFKVEIE